MEKTVDRIITGLKTYSSPNEERIRRAFALARKYHTGQKRHSGDPYISHPLAVAEILLTLKADEDAIIVAFLHDVVEDTKLTVDDIKNEFGSEVAHLVNGLTKISSNQITSEKKESRLRSLRKMFEVMGSDIRTIIIKLCDRLHNMRTLAAFPLEKQVRIARETLEIYVPITEKLNLDLLRRELLTECYQVLIPQLHTAFLDTQERNVVLAEAIQRKLFAALRHAPETPEFHLEMLSKTHVARPDETPEDLAKLELADTHLLRILVPKPHLCYQTLFVLHQVYRGQPNTFKDYITTPKANGYQALHTKIIDDAGNLLQVQILTPEMAEIAARGITFYWQGDKNALRYQNLKKLPLRITWLENLAQFSQEPNRSHEELLEYLQRDFLRKRIFVLDENGQTFDIPAEATVLDFLYTAYPERAGYVDRVWVNTDQASLDRPLADGDKIEFETGSVLRTEVKWLDFVRTYSGKKLIQSDLLKYAPSRQGASGEILIQKEFDTHNKGLMMRFSRRKWIRVAHHFQSANLEGLFRDVGTGKIRAEEVFSEFFSKKNPFSPLRYAFTVQGAHAVPPLSQVVTAAEKSQIHLLRSKMRYDTVQARVDIELMETPQGKISGFLQMLKNDPAIRSVRAKLPFSSKVLLGVLWSAVFIIFGAFFLIRDSFGAYQVSTVGKIRNIVTYLPLLILIAVNTVSARSMRNYLQSMRQEKIYMFTSILLNLLSIVMVSLLFRYLRISLDIAVLFVIFLVSILVNSYQYMKDSATFLEPHTEISEDPAFSAYQDQKNWGYLFRLCAVCIFGISPLVVKYFLFRMSGTFVSGFSFVLAAGFLLPIASIKYFLPKAKQRTHWKERYDVSFFAAVLFDGLMVMVYFLSVQYTIASDAGLFLNFAPVVALVLTLLFFRKRVPYLRHKTDTMRIILFFLLGCIGSAILVINKIPVAIGSYSQKLFGDALAGLIVLFDVIGTMATIHYAKKKGSFNGFDFIIRKIFFLAVIFSPLVFPKIFSFHFTIQEWFAFSYLALCYVILGYWFAYEAFRRVDGLIAYLLLNLGPLVTISLEVLFFDLPLSFNLVIGAVMILGSSLAAEYINSKHDKKRAIAVDTAEM